MIDLMHLLQFQRVHLTRAPIGPVLCFFILLLTACGLSERAANSGLRLQTNGGHQVRVVRPSKLPAPMRLVASVGRESGPGSFSAIAAATGGADGSVLLNEAATCRLILVDTLGSPQVPGFGGCGDGPGELRRLKGLTRVGDSVVAFLSEEPSFRVYRLDGTEVGRGTINESFPPGTDLQGGTGVAGGGLVVSLAIPPAVLRATGEDGGRVLSPVGLLDLRTRSVTPFPIRSAPVVARNVANFVSGPSVCSLRPGGLVAVLNEWTPQLLLVDPLTGEVKHEVRVEGDYAPVELAEPMVGYRPRALASTVACGEGYAVLWTREGEVADGKTRIAGGLIGVVDEKGEVLGVARYASTDTLLFARPVAVSGGRIAAVTNTFTVFPQLLYLQMPWPLGHEHTVPLVGRE